MDNALDDFSSDSLRSAVNGGTSRPAPSQPQASFNAQGTYGTPGKLLDNLQRTESSGNAYAINPDSKAMGPYQFTPDTVAMLHKQGVKFDPFDHGQARAAADYYVSQLASQNGGDYAKAMAAYGGFKTKDPSGYVSKVMAGVGTSPTQPAPANPSHNANDPMADFSSNSLRAAVNSAPAAPVTAPAKSTAPQTVGDIGKDAVANMGNASEGLQSVIGQQLTGLGSSIIGGYQGLAKLATGGSLDDAANAVTKYQQEHTYQPPAGSAGAKATEAFNSNVNPLNWPSAAIDYAADKTAEKFGPAAGTAVKTAGNAAMLVAGTRGKAPVTIESSIGAFKPEVVSPGTGVYRPVSLASSAPNVSAAMVDARTPAPIQAPTAGSAAAQLRAQFDQRQGTTAPGAPATAPVQSAPAPGNAGEQLRAQFQQRQAPGAPAQPAAGQTANASGAATPQPGAPVAEALPEVVATEQMPQGSKLLALPEQYDRASVLNAVGLDNADKSALQGNHMDRAIKYQMSKFDEPAGSAAADQFTREQQALGNYTRGMIQDAGGTVGTDNTANYARGQTILKPLNDLNQWYEQRTGELYKAADERAQGQPVQLPGFHELLNDAGELTNSDRIHLKDALTSRLKKLGMLGEDGTVSGNAQQAETIRKYLNENYSPANGKLVGKLKEALDMDVTQAAGSDIYGAARQLWTERKNTLDNPKGIANLLQEEGPDGINRSIPKEQIAKRLAGMDVDQFSHIVQTLKNVPPELQGQAQAALGEIKAQYLNQMLEDATGTRGGNSRPMWNGTGVKNVLNTNRMKMEKIFTPQELNRIDTLRKAGDILSFNPTYPGAAAQAHNALKAGLMTRTLGKLATGAGGAVGGLAGATVGSPVIGAGMGATAGEWLGSKMTEGSALKKYQKSQVRLSDFLGVQK